MRVTSGILIIGASLLLPLPARAERVEQLNPRGYVNDFAGVIGPEIEAELTALCAEVDRKTRAQIAVVTIQSLEGQPVEDFGHRLASRWGVGYKGDNRGVLILLAVSDRKYRIEVGYGLEPILPDGKVGGFGREMVPRLRQGDYGGALLSLTRRLADVIAQDRGVTLSPRPTARAPARPVRPTAPPSAGREPDSGAGLFGWLIILVFIWLVARNVGLRGGSGNGGSWGGGGDFGGFGGGDFGGGGASGSW